MIRISTTQLWVHDQDEALAFWRDKVGFEVREDVTVAEMGNFRWLALAPPGQDDISVVLMAIPGPPMIDAATADEIAKLTAKGFSGTLFLTTDDCQATYDELSARGVVFNDPPTPQPYGIDTSFRDPSGNNVRVTQVMEFSYDRT